MKKLSKRLLALLMSVILCLGLCACGGGEEGTTEDDGLVTELSLWFPYGALSQAYLQKLVDEFNASQEEYFVEIQNMGSVVAVRQELDSTLSPSDYPDIICGQTIATAYYANASWLKKVQDFVNQEETDWTQGVFTSVRDTYTDLDGNLLGYPLGVSCSGYWVNVDAVTEAGYTLDDLTSYEKIIEVATAIANNGICEYGISYNEGTVELLDMMTIQGVDYVDSDNGFGGKITKSLLLEGETYDAYKKATELFAQTYSTGIAYEFGTGGSKAFNQFNAGKLAIVYATNSWGHCVFDGNPDFEYAFIPSVGIDNNAKYLGNVLVEGTGLYMCNTENEKKMQGAYEFIKFMAQPENQSQYCQCLGYVPYTEEAVAQADYQEWMTENLPSSQNIIDKIQNTPAELRTPYVEFFDEMLSVTNTLYNYVALDPNFKNESMETYMKNAAKVMEDGLTVWAERQ